MAAKDRLRRVKPTLKLITVIVVLISVVYVSWLSARYFLATDYPLVYVASNSMYPTLRVGDLLFVKGVKPEDIRVGDVVIFIKPTGTGERIVHRVVSIKRVDGKVLITTKGDNNPSSIYWERDFDSSYVVGKVFFWVRFIGFIPMILQEEYVKWGITAVLLILILYDFLSGIFEEEKPSEGKE